MSSLASAKRGLPVIPIPSGGRPLTGEVFFYVSQTKTVRKPIHADLLLFRSSQFLQFQQEFE